MSTKYFIAFVACFSIMVTACGSSSSNPNDTNKVKTTDQGDSGDDTQGDSGTGTQDPFGDGTTSGDTTGGGTTGGDTTGDSGPVVGPVVGGPVIVTPVRVRLHFTQCYIERADPCRRYRRRTGMPAICTLFHDPYIGECIEIIPPIVITY